MAANNVDEEDHMKKQNILSFYLKIHSVIPFYKYVNWMYKSVKFHEKYVIVINRKRFFNLICCLEFWQCNSRHFLCLQPCPNNSFQSINQLEIHIKPRFVISEALKNVQNYWLKFCRILIRFLFLEHPNCLLLTKCKGYRLARRLRSSR